jgi:hypothetical protein
VTDTNNTDDNRKNGNQIKYSASNVSARPKQ